MRSHAPIWFAVTGALVLSCRAQLTAIPPCTTDLDCGSEEICFQDGCGDPGRGLTMQVTHQGVAQEFPINELRSTYDQELGRPPVFTGQIKQATATGQTPFTGKVILRGFGQTLHLPGVGRRIDASVLPFSGGYSAGISTGEYGGAQFGPLHVFAEAGGPPVRLNGSWSFQPGSRVPLDVTFPPAAALTRITGTLLLSLNAGVMTTPMQVQVLEPGWHRPISQIVPVDPITGLFTVLAPPMAPGEPFEILATPRDGMLAESITPVRVFPGTVTGSITTLLLQMEEFGSTVSLSGTVLDSKGQPLGGAKVFTERQIQGGKHNYKGGSTTTASDGSFLVKALPTLSVDDPVSLWIIPDSGLESGTLQVVLSVPLQDGSLPPLRCPPRVPVVGQVLRPNEQPAAGVLVRAQPLEAATAGGSKPPGDPVEVTTDAQGNFRLFADPGEYRLDFLPDLLPRVSRRVTVYPQPGTATPEAVQVPTFTLWNGRTLSGKITGFPTAGAIEPAALPNASVELFRVVWEDGKQNSYSLGKVTTDSEGKYILTIPTAPSTEDTPGPG